jgi:hypothetical protein
LVGLKTHREEATMADEEAIAHETDPLLDGPPPGDLQDDDPPDAASDEAQTLQTALEEALEQADYWRAFANIAPRVVSSARREVSKEQKLTPGKYGPMFMNFIFNMEYYIEMLCEYDDLSGPAYDRAIIKAKADTAAAMARHSDKFNFDAAAENDVIADKVTSIYEGVQNGVKRMRERQQAEARKVIRDA